MLTQAVTAPVAAQQRFALTSPLSLGELYLGDVEVEVDTDGNGVVDLARLIELVAPKVAAEVADRLADLQATLADGEQAVAFDAFEGTGLAVTYDPATFGLTVDVASTLRLSRPLRFGGLAAPDPDTLDAPAAAAGGVQFSIQQSLGRDQGDDTVGRAEGYLTIGGFEGVTLLGAADYGGRGGEGASFDFATLVRDDFERAIRYEAGTVLPLATGFQSSARLYGVGVSRRYQDIRPFDNIRPAGRQDLVLERRSTVRITVDGAEVRTLDLAPGRYDLDDLPLARGRNDVVLEVTDVTGRTEVIERSVLFSPVLLAPGLTDFGAWAGAATGDAVSDVADEPAASAFVARGFDAATLGVSGQATAAGTSLGGSAVIASQLGFVSAQGAWSRAADGRSGLALGLDARAELSWREPDDLRINLTAAATGSSFFDPFQASAQNRTRREAAGNVALRLGRSTVLSAGGGYRDQRGASDTWQANAGVSRRFGGLNGRLFARLRGDGDGTDTSLLASVTVPLGDQVRAGARYDSGTRRSEIEVARVRRRQSRDWSARAAVGNQDGSDDFSGTAAWFGQRVGLRADHDRVLPNGGPAGDETLLRASTFVGFAGNTVGWGREGLDGFTMVRRHPSLRGAGAAFSQAGQVVYRADGLGPAVVPALRPYTVLRQDVIVDALPPGYALETTGRSILPGFRTGHRLQIGSNAYLSATGVLRREDGAPAALLIGQLVAQRGDVSADFFTTQDGRFYAQGLAAGEYAVIVGGETRGILTVATPDEGLLSDVGEVVIDGR